MSMRVNEIEKKIKKLEKVQKRLKHWKEILRTISTSISAMLKDK
jgi:hypothetical protein